jgi:hypothetical protein
MQFLTHARARTESLRKQLDESQKERHVLVQAQHRRDDELAAARTAASRATSEHDQLVHETDRLRAQAAEDATELARLRAELQNERRAAAAAQEKHATAMRERTEAFTCKVQKLDRDARALCEQYQRQLQRLTDEVRTKLGAPRT